MKKSLSSVFCFLCSTSLLFAQKQTNNIILPDSSQTVILTMNDLSRMQGTIIESRGDTLLFKSKGLDLIFLSKKNVKSLELKSKLKPQIIIPEFMIKISGLPIPTDSYIFDKGIEIKLKNQWTVQFSHSARRYSSDEGSLKKQVFTPQIRYYFEKKNWHQSTYCGLVLQKHTEQNSEAIYEQAHKYIGDETQQFTKFGAGLITGIQLGGKVFGGDFHIGVLTEKGNDTTVKETIGIGKTTTIVNQFKARVFWGFHVFLAIKPRE